MLEVHGVRPPIKTTSPAVEGMLWFAPFRVFRLDRRGRAGFPSRMVAVGEDGTDPGLKLEG